VTGKVGADCTTAEARQAARLTALAMLSTIESVLGTGSVFVHHGEPLRRFAVLPTYFLFPFMVEWNRTKNTYVAHTTV
jgi:hypothetical protein